MTPHGTERSAPTSKSSFWIRVERLAQRVRQLAGEHDPERRVELVDGAERADPAVELRDARAVAERGLARVAAARVDPRQPDRLVARLMRFSAGSRCSSRMWRAITSRWISLVPS